MSYIPLTAKRIKDTYPCAHAHLVDETENEVQYRRDEEMVEFLIEIICEYSVGTVYGETDDRCEENFMQDIHRYADRYRCDRYQFVKNRQFLYDLHESYECKRLTVLKCNLFLNGIIVFEDLVDFVNGWGADVDMVKQLDCDKCDIELMEMI